MDLNSTQLNSTQLDSAELDHPYWGYHDSSGVRVRANLIRLELDSTRVEPYLERFAPKVDRLQ